MSDVNQPLYDRWLALMRQSTERSIGQECSYGLDPDSADTFDPLGLLVFAALELLGVPPSRSEWGEFFRHSALNGGEWVDRFTIYGLLRQCGFSDPERVATWLAEASDAGVSWEDLVVGVEVRRG